MLLKIGRNDFILAGTGVVVSFASAYEKARENQQVLGEDGFVAAGSKTIRKNSEFKFNGKRKGIASVDEISIDADDRMNYVRRNNGDQDHQGRHARISCDDWKILHIRLYDYD